MLTPLTGTPLSEPARTWPYTSELLAMRGRMCWGMPRVVHMKSLQRPVLMSISMVRLALVTSVQCTPVSFCARDRA
jgi:hypothetical protein